MNYKKDSLLKFILGLALILVGIGALVLIMGNNAPMIQKPSPIAQEKEKKSNIILRTDKNQLEAGTLPSNKKKEALEISNLERAQSRFSKKIVALESKVDELKENILSVADSDLEWNSDQDSIEDSETKEEKFMAQMSDYIERMEDKLQSEAVDAEWSDSAMKVLYRAAQENTDSSFEIVSVDFGSTLCRFDLVGNPAHLEESFVELRARLSWPGRAFFYADDIESGKAIVYLAREGHSLPRFSEE